MYIYIYLTGDEAHFVDILGFFTTLPEGGLFPRLKYPQNPHKSRHSQAPELEILERSCWPIEFKRLGTKPDLGGGFKYLLVSPLFGEDSHFD